MISQRINKIGIAGVERFMNAIERSRNVRFGWSMFLLLFCLSLILIPRSLPQNIYYAILGGGAFMGFAGVLLLLRSFYLHDMRRELVIGALINEPASLVWIYHFVVIYSPFGFRFNRGARLYIHLIDGKSFSINIKLSEAELITREFKKRLPQCTFGYSIEKEQLYRANPALLQKGLEARLNPKALLHRIFAP